MSKKAFIFSLLLSIFSICAMAQESTHITGAPLSGEVGVVTNENEVVAAASKRIVENQQFSVYPNPSFGVVNILAPEGSTVTVYSASGTYVGTWKIDGLDPLVLDELGEGNFIVSILTGELRTIKKLMVLPH